MIPLRHVDTFRTRECVIESNRLILSKGKKGSTMLTIHSSILNYTTAVEHMHARSYYKEVAYCEHGANKPASIYQSFTYMELHTASLSIFCAYDRPSCYSCMVRIGWSQLVPSDSALLETEYVL